MSLSSTHALLGFKTEQGSLYRYDQSDSTSERLKISGGQGQGKWHVKSMCLFVDPTQFERAKEIFGVPGISLKFAYYSSDDMLTTLGNTLRDVPPGRTPAVIFFDNANKKAVAALPAQMRPAVGLLPIEKAYTNGTSYTHAGSVVVGLETSPFIFDLHVQTALRALKGSTPPFLTSALIPRPS